MAWGRAAGWNSEGEFPSQSTSEAHYQVRTQSMLAAGMGQSS